MAAVLEPDDGRWRWVAGGLVLSLLVHLVAAGGISSIPERVEAAAEWVELAVAEVKPPEPPPPPPEPPAPPPKPEVVEYQEPTPQPDAPPPPQPVAPTPRVVQGLDNNSFVKGAGTGLAVNAGTTTAAKATSEKMDLDDATGTQFVPYGSVTNPPKERYKPSIVVPDSVKEAKIEGRVELALTIDATGKVTSIEVLASLHPDADEACRKALSTSRWKPGDKDGVPVVTTKVPYSCRFEATS